MSNTSGLPDKTPFLIASLVFILSLAISLYFATKIKQEIVSNNLNVIFSQSEKIAVNFQATIDRSVFDLYTLQSFYNTQQSIEYHQFKRFTQLLLKDIDVIRALEWIPKVNGSNREEFVTQQKVHFKDFQIKALKESKRLKPSNAKAVYYPVTFIQPLVGNENALGLDLNSNAVRRSTLEYARDTGEITATEQISLVQDKLSSNDFLMVAPVYLGGTTPTTLELRQENLKGFVLGVFQVKSLIKEIKVQAENEGLSMSLIDLDAGKSPRLFGQNSHFDFTFDINLPQRAWQLQFTLTDTLRSQLYQPTLYHWTLAFGLTISCLLAISTFSLKRISSDRLKLMILNTHIQNHNQNLEAKVQDRTQSLAIKNDELSANVSQLIQSREALNKLMTELKKQKEEAEHKSIELARSNKELDEFAYVASHDLKAPLRGIDQLASWIEEDLASNDKDEIPEHLSSIRQRVTRLEKLLIDLLEYSKVGRHEEKISQVNSKQLIKDIFMLNTPSNQCELRFANRFPEHLNVTAQFELIIRNLIGNAIKHSNNDTLHIEFDCTENENAYTFSITDNGPGIDSKHFEQIFQMFKTLKPRDKVEGSGMGLALIKKVVNSYGGNVYVESTLGQGTTFFFNWPKNLSK